MSTPTDVGELLALGRKIWGSERMTPAEIVIAMGVVHGDICRIVRDKPPEALVEFRKELGNMIFSAIRWCDDCGLAPAECIEAAVEAQRQFADHLWQEARRKIEVR